jgi:hypothetical protein
MNTQLTANYLARLEAALGYEQRFPAIHAELGGDQRVGQPEMIEILSRFLAPVAQSTSRPKAWRRILYRHEKLLEARAVSASMAAKR